MSSIDVQCAVIGGGVIGLAVARCLVRQGLEVALLEAETQLGSKTSSRNSEVIHAGIYYPRGSLKAVHCVRGRNMLYRYCEQHDIPHRRCGKLIVANGPRQERELEQIRAAAQANGVDDIAWLDAAQVSAREPLLRASAALYSPSTGIIDSHSYMQQLGDDIELSGGMILRRHAVVGGQVLPDHAGFMLAVLAGDEAFNLRSDYVINCAGADATGWLAQVSGFASQYIPTLHYARGSYFSMQPALPVSHLVYPLPNSAGLGTHLTLDMQGGVRFGPDVEWLDNAAIARDNEQPHAPLLFDYRVDESRREIFAQAIADYYPQIDASMLVPDYSGVRSKLVGPGEPPADFMIQGDSVHGLPGWVNLFGIESPGLTSSLSLAEAVAEKLLPGRQLVRENFSGQHQEQGLQG